MLFYSAELSKNGLKLNQKNMIYTVCILYSYIQVHMCMHKVDI